jgi:diguanylate cyclase (GGDEF)-like protein
LSVPLDQVIEDVAEALDDAGTVPEACQRAVDVLATHTPAMIGVMLAIKDHLRCVAATGSWQVYATIPLGVGVAGRVHRTGRTEVVTDVAADPNYISLGPEVAVEICAPIPNPQGQPAGALNLEWTRPVDPELWRPVVEELARRIGARVAELGGPPTESASEKLLRHALAFSTARDERELLNDSLLAAREVSGLSTPVVLLPRAGGARAFRDYRYPTPLGDRLAALDREVLGRIAVRARRHGAAYTLGDPKDFDAHGFELLTSIGVGTMISVPVGPGRDTTADPASAGGVLLVVDERAIRSNPAVANLLELLAAHAWTSMDRLETLRQLNEKASSDPLTGLRHYGAFGERLARTAAARTALLAIDVDQFKQLNDRYGHQAGDRILVDLAHTLQTALRSGDELYRIGGDEFAAVIEVQREAEALAVAERLVVAARRLGRTVSVGVALRAPHESAADTLHRADLALYEAKRTGRDAARLGGTVTGATE